MSENENERISRKMKDAIDRLDADALFDYISQTTLHMFLLQGNGQTRKGFAGIWKVSYRLFQI